jgi:MFS family permease
MEAPSPRPRISIYPILSVNFVGTLGFSIVLPFLVFLVTRLGGNAFVYGIMGATYSFFQLVGAPLLGRWSDRYGRRRILLLSHLGTLASWVIFLGALYLPVRALWSVDSPWLGAFTVTVPLAVLFLARALDGLTGGNVSVANAYLADITEPSERSADFGKMAVAQNLGFIVGPAIAGALGATAFGETLPVLAALLISFAAAFIIAFKLPESRACVLQASPERASVRNVLGPDQRLCYELRAAPRLSIGDILRLRSIPLVLSLHFLVYLAFNLFYIAFPIHAAIGLEWSLPEVGLFFSVTAVIMVIVQGPVLSYAARHWSDRALVVFGSPLLGLSFVFYTSAGTPTIYAGTVLLALGNGLMWPSLLAVLSKASGADSQGAVQGFAGSLAAVASIVGLLAGGVLYGLVGERIFVLSATLTLAVFLLSLTLSPPEPEPLLQAA